VVEHAHLDPHRQAFLRRRLHRFLQLLRLDGHPDDAGEGVHHPNARLERARSDGAKQVHDADVSGGDDHEHGRQTDDDAEPRKPRSGGDTAFELRRETGQDDGREYQTDGDDNGHNPSFSGLRVHRQASRPLFSTDFAALFRSNECAVLINRRSAEAQKRRRTGGQKGRRRKGAGEPAACPISPRLISGSIEPGL
jgi:hypothetical protein